MRCFCGCGRTATVVDLVDNRDSAFGVIAFSYSGGTDMQCLRTRALVWVAAITAVVAGRRPAIAMADGFPISVADVQKVLGPPTNSDEDVLDYKDKINVRVSPLGHMEVMVTPDGMALAYRLFRSKLFTEEEGQRILMLLKAKGGEKTVGRFTVTAKESTIIDGMVILKIMPNK